MNPGVRDKIGLELGDVNIESSIKSQRCSQRGVNLSDDSVQICVSWAFDVQVSSANVVNGFIVQYHADICVLQ